MKKLLITFLILTGMIFSTFAKDDNSMKENELTRIQNVMAKIRRGEDVKVVSLGGSITTGFSASPANTKGWAGLTGSWLKNLAKENNCKLTFANQGVSGTDSAFAVARLQDHVISLNPDLLILEFAMNDQWLETKVRQRTYEGIIRKVMNNTDTAILALFVNERKAPYPSNQAEQEKICEYYNIPYVSWKDSLFKADKNASFEEFFDGTETVHPNTKGHANIASFIIEKLDSIWKNLPEDKDIPSVVKELPKAMTDAGFENARYYHMDNITALTNTGWTNGSPVHSEWVSHGNARKGWETNVAGAEITFEVEGSSVGITYCESDQFRDAIAWVTKPDGSISQKIPLKCFVSYRNGYYGWAYKELISSDKVEKYTVHIQCSKRAPKSAAGKFCNITGILVSGEK